MIEFKKKCDHFVILDEELGTEKKILQKLLEEEFGLVQKN